MRLLLFACAWAAALAGCRSAEELAPADLSSSAIYCPAAPPGDESYVCDPSAIPYCTFPREGVTCTCQLVDRGRHVLVCPVDMGATD
jgi:hypothetical protein